MGCPKLWFLKNYYLFEGVPEETIEAVAVNIFLKECEKECTIYQPLDTMNYIYIVNKGEIQLYHEKNGKKLVFDTLGPGSIFGNTKGEQKQNSHGHYAVGGPGSCICMVPVDEFLKIVSEYPQVALRFLNKFSEQIADYQEKLRQKHDSAEEIILHELTRLHQKRQQGFLERFMDRPLRVTHEQLAEHTGLNRVTVTKTMKKLKEAGKIKHDSKTGIIEIV